MKNDIQSIHEQYMKIITEGNEGPRYNNGMIKLIRDCEVLVDNGSNCGDGCCWDSWWEREMFSAGEEIDPDDCRINISDLEEGEDFVYI